MKRIPEQEVIRKTPVKKEELAIAKREINEIREGFHQDYLSDDEKALQRNLQETEEDLIKK